MKAKIIALGFSAIAMIALSGCAGNQYTSNRSITQAEYAKASAEEIQADASTTASASAKLDSAKVLKDMGKDEEATALADQSSLEYRLAIANAEKQAAGIEDEKVAKELEADIERKQLYQNVLDKELNKDAGGNN